MRSPQGSVLASRGEVSANSYLDVDVGVNLSCELCNDGAFKVSTSLGVDEPLSSQLAGLPFPHASIDSRCSAP